jgi:2-isopropylmalate synthase
VSELAGRSNVLAKAGELGLDLDADPALGTRVLDRVKELEHRGYAFEVADASFELLVRREAGTFDPPFTLEGYRVMVERKEDGTDSSEATVRLLVDGERVLAVGEGVGPVHALDQALRRALAPCHPELTDVSLVDFKVRILDGRAGTSAVTRVLVTSADPDAEWTTVGVSDDIVTASWEALTDGIHYGLLRAKQEVRVA